MNAAPLCKLYAKPYRLSDRNTSSLLPSSRVVKEKLDKSLENDGTHARTLNLYLQRSGRSTGRPLWTGLPLFIRTASLSSLQVHLSRIRDSLRSLRCSPGLHHHSRRSRSRLCSAGMPIPASCHERSPREALQGAG